MGDVELRLRRSTDHGLVVFHRSSAVERGCADELDHAQPETVAGAWNFTPGLKENGRLLKLGRRSALRAARFRCRDPVCLPDLDSGPTHVATEFQRDPAQARWRMSSARMTRCHRAPLSRCADRRELPVDAQLRRRTVALHVDLKRRAVVHELHAVRRSATTGSVRLVFLT